MTKLARRIGPTSRVRVAEFLPRGRARTRGPGRRRGAAGDQDRLARGRATAGLGDHADARARLRARRGLGVPRGARRCARAVGGRLLHRRGPHRRAGVQRGDAPRSPTPVDLAHRHDAMSAGSSACGVCGKDSIEAALSTVRGTRWTGPRPQPDVVRRLPALLREEQSVFARTGGVHAAGLFTADGDRHVVREDVGRHNAVDKVSGARLLAGEPPPTPISWSAVGPGSSWCRRPSRPASGRWWRWGRRRRWPSTWRRGGLGLFGFTRTERTPLPDRCSRHVTPAQIPCVFVPSARSAFARLGGRRDGVRSRT